MLVVLVTLTQLFCSSRFDRIRKLHTEQSFNIVMPKWFIKRLAFTIDYKG